MLSTALAVTLDAVPACGVPMDATVNNQPVHLRLDAGYAYPVLYRSTAERIGLKINKAHYDAPIPSGYARMDEAEEATLTFGPMSKRIKFGVIDVPPYGAKGFDGVLTWTTISDWVLLLGFDQNAWALTNTLPMEVASWTKWKLIPDSRLMFGL